jgi:hypothetical protein
VGVGSGNYFINKDHNKKKKGGGGEEAIIYTEEKMWPGFGGMDRGMKIEMS